MGVLVQTIISLEFEHKKWSWGYTSQFLFSELKPFFEVISMEYRNWKREGVFVKDRSQICYLSQNATQLKGADSLLDYRKTIARLGGNRTFEVSPDRKEEYTWVMGKCFALIVTNERLREIAEKANKNVYLIPNGLNLDHWEFILRKGSTDKTLIVGFVGNISTVQKSLYKGHEITESVCLKLGFLLKEALYKNKQIPHDQMQKKFYGKIDVLVLLTDGEGCSNTIMEALACGVPVITTKEAGFHGEKMIHEENILFCEKTKRKLEEILLRLAEDSKLVQKLSVNGRKFAEENHDIKKIAKEYRRVFSACFEAQKKIKVKNVRVAIKTAPVPLFSPDDFVTVVCVLKSGGNFNTDYVVKLKNMIERNSTVSHNFVCLTDVDSTLYETIKLSCSRKSWWAKTELFRFGLVQSKYIIYFDLDTIILSNIDDILSFPFEKIRGLRPWNKENRQKEMMASGMMGWKNDGTYSFIHEMFNMKYVGKYPKGDQEYISSALKNEDKAIEFLQDKFTGIYSYKRNCRASIPEDARIICFHGKPRLHEMKDKWVRENWK